MNPSPKKERLKWLWTALRIVVGLALIAFLLWKCDLHRILGHVRAMGLGYLGYAMVPYFVFIIVSAWRWHILLVHKGVKTKFLRTVVVYFISVFFGNVLPTTIGGDVVRVVYGIPGRKTESLATIIADRILGFVGLFIFTLICVLYVFIVHHRIEFLSFAIIGLVILGFTAYFLFSERTYSFFSPFIQKIKVFRLGERLSDLHRIMTDFGGAWKLIAACLVLSIAIQALLALAPFFVLRSMGNFSIGVLPFFLYVPVINIVSMIPVSLSALGVRENAYVLFFSRVGIDGAVAFTMSLVSFFLYFVWTLVGGICFIFFKKEKVAREVE